MDDQDRVFRVSREIDGIWIGVLDSGNRVEVRGWSEIERLRSRWRRAPQWADDDLCTFSELFGLAPPANGYNYVTSGLSPQDEDDGGDDMSDDMDGFGEDAMGEEEEHEGHAGDDGPDPNELHKQDLEQQIAAERAEIGREQARLGGVGPIQAQQLNAEIAQRNQVIANLEQQLSHLP
jgi:hypothetical protein